MLALQHACRYVDSCPPAARVQPRWYAALSASARITANRRMQPSGEKGTIQVMSTLCAMLCKAASRPYMPQAAVAYKCQGMKKQRCHAASHASMLQHVASSREKRQRRERRRKGRREKVEREQDR